MSNKRSSAGWKWIILAIVILIILKLVSQFYPKDKPQTIRSVKVKRGDIALAITATGQVKPQNRIEMKPPIGGRIEKILVEEGQQVKTGDILALMSSTERAALLDAARSQGAKSLSDWEEAYKPTPIIAPIDAEVIVRAVEPGQTVTPTDPVVVLSDRLIVEAQVDETDIGRVKEGQKAVISLDAYPEIHVDAKVQHIYYESKIINNVTIYQVDILPEKVPEVFRSGMSANVRIIKESKDGVLLVPLEAVKRGKEGSFVFLSQGQNNKPVKHPVELGMTDDTNAEVVSGLDENDTLVIETQKYSPSKNSKTGSNPFMPAPAGRRKSN